MQSILGEKFNATKKISVYTYAECIARWIFQVKFWGSKVEYDGEVVEKGFNIKTRASYAIAEMKIEKVRQPGVHFTLFFLFKFTAIKICAVKRMNESRGK